MRPKDRASRLKDDLIDLISSVSTVARRGIVIPSTNNCVTNQGRFSDLAAIYHAARIVTRPRYRTVDGNCPRFAGLCPPIDAVPAKRSPPADICGGGLSYTLPAHA